MTMTSMIPKENISLGYWKTLKIYPKENIEMDGPDKFAIKNIIF